jgi:hypothetical protein
VPEELLDSTEEKGAEGAEAVEADDEKTASRLSSSSRTTTTRQSAWPASECFGQRTLTSTTRFAIQATPPSAQEAEGLLS